MWPFSPHLWQVRPKFYEEAFGLEEEALDVLPFFLDLTYLIKAIVSNFVEVALNQSSLLRTMGANSSHKISIILLKVIKEE